MEGKLLPRLTFNPELALTGFRTTRPRLSESEAEAEAEEQTNHKARNPTL